MWKQVRGFNANKGGKQKGMCLKNTRLGYGIGPVYATAWDAWNGTIQHRNRNYPAGVYTPIFFEYVTTIGGVKKNWGHIGVRYPDGRFWTDGEVFSSVEAYERARVPKMVGWGESVNNVRVIEKVKGPAMPPVGSWIQLIPRDTRTTFRAGTTATAGRINVTDNTFRYLVRGYDSKFPGRILINSASAGGNGVALALYYTNGVAIPGWRRV